MLEKKTSLWHNCYNGLKKKGGEEVVGGLNRRGM